MRNQPACSSILSLIKTTLKTSVQICFPGRRARLAVLIVCVALLPAVFIAPHATSTSGSLRHDNAPIVPATKIEFALLLAPAPVVLDPCLSPANAIVSENCQPGNSSIEWDVIGAGDPTIQGFATDISVNRGETVQFKINTNATNYHLDIYRMGYYGGNGARKVATIQPAEPLPQTQPSCLTDAASGLIDCGNWAVSATWGVPVGATSGIYFAKLVREDTNGASHIVFIVRNDGGTSDLLFQTSDSTWQAYNDYGGNSLYAGSPGTNPNRAYKVSYNRPFNTRAVDGGEDWLFNSEYPMVRWLEANGYNVSYFTGVDTDRRGAELLTHKIFMSVGHDEYWSGTQRTNVEVARSGGVNLAFFSGDEIFWKTRWEASIDGLNTSHRTLVSYKETHADARIDPLPNVWTGTWRDSRVFNPEGGRPENALSGTLFMVNGDRNDAIEVPAADGRMRFWRNTTIANLAPGTTATLPQGTLGYEWDEDLDNGSRPTGLFRLSSTSIDVDQCLQDFGNTFAPTCGCSRPQSICSLIWATCSPPHYRLTTAWWPPLDRPTRPRPPQLLALLQTTRPYKLESRLRSQARRQT